MTVQASGLEVFPEEYRADIERSDLDLAVRGCPPRSFFPLLGELLTELEHSVDLVDLDRESRLVGFLQKHELLVHVG